MAKIASKAIVGAEKQKKDKYRVTNWSSYNKSLVRRGNRSIWIEEEAISNWYYEGPSQKGGQYEYSDTCIECLLGLKVVFSLAYRQLEGFACSIISLMGFEVQVPVYSQICRRASSVWRKLHLGVDEKTGMIHAQILTGNGKGDGDAQQVEDMLEQVESPIDKFSGDGAYDTYDIWECIGWMKTRSF